LEPITATPAFGKADLSNCEREQIHLAGSIQPHGALLVLSEPDLRIVQVSANAADFLGTPDEIVGRAAAELEGDLGERLSPLLREPLHDIPAPVRCEIGPHLLDCLVHRPADGGIVVELEKAAPPADLSHQLAAALQSIVASASLKALCDEVAAIFKDITGYDRVMVYRFDDAGHGEIFAERRRVDLEPFLGNRYPASDIPQIARRLYERTRVRVLVDVDYAPVPLRPRLCPLSGRDLDMSLCFLRSMSPIHIQYLKNMGVGATLVVSLLVGGKLWGLVACHHYEPRKVHLQTRAACEVIAEAIGTRISALDGFVRAQAELAVRRLEQRMLEAIGRIGDWRAALFDAPQALLQPVGATGAALLFDGGILTAGDVPATQQVREIGAWLDGKPRFRVFASKSLAAEEPRFQAVLPVASGLLAAPVSGSLGEYLLWFRPEQVQTVTWGGDPSKPFVIGNDPSDLSPRRSFAQWHQLVEGTSEPWSPADLAAARLIGESVTDVVVQFRSVRMLIAQDQLETISREVRSSDQPVVIADSRGRILLQNEAFERLLRGTHTHLQWLGHLAPFFAEPETVREQLRALVSDGQGWRGELTLETERGGLPLHLRSDPIRSPSGRLLGFVLLLTDLTERKAAEAARRRFQEGTIDRPRYAATRLDAKADLLYRNLLASVIENAQLAALEIADGLDTARMPEALESVRGSVARTAAVLEMLIQHTSAPRTEAAERHDQNGATAEARARRRSHPGNGRQPPSEPLRRG